VWTNRVGGGKGNVGGGEKKSQIVAWLIHSKRNFYCTHTTNSNYLCSYCRFIALCNHIAVSQRRLLHKVREKKALIPCGIGFF